MIVHNVLQGSDEWMKLRCGIPTASEMDALLTPEFKLRTGEGVQTYLAKKLAEKWLGRPLPSFSGFGDLEQGTILEEEAIPYYECENNCTIQRVGFITTDDGKAGCSPDGLIQYECGPGKQAIAAGGIEIKSPAIHTHVGYLLRWTLPKDYAAQVHGSMYVTGAPWWKFMSYNRHCPPLILTVERDEEIQKKIAEALASFNASFDAAYAKLTSGAGMRAVRVAEATPAVTHPAPLNIWGGVH